MGTLRESLPAPSEVPVVTQIHESIAAQETFIASMAEKLDSLLLHFDQMAEALKDCEAGVAFGEDDLSGGCIRF